MSPSPKKINAKRREDFIKTKSKNFEKKDSSSEVSHKITKASNHEKSEIFQRDKCTDQDKSKCNKQQHINNEHQNMIQDDSRGDYRDFTEVPEIPINVETEDIR